MPAPQGSEILQFHCPIAVHGSRVAWAAGKNLVIYNFGVKKFERDLSETKHTDTIRAIAFSKDGEMVATAGEDKRVVVQGTSGEVKEFLHGKKIMAVHVDDSGVVAFGKSPQTYLRTKQLLNHGCAC